ncbi:citrate synthase [Actinacidiphila yanglinensis]|uniref:citrate synthase (unknown stereospecificity) n=1 Tax=Actinacidiphila yanglinensis TaxID=310779 RepID=A0A1H6DBW1_9ACTN|nr:citryl-CoA lyase [Actinacidiphila yanglinensis]SEG82672.1 citrate synthase [Actinacidiphila yanglinensis]
MRTTTAEEGDRKAADWWATSVIRMAPGVVELRGRPVQDLIGSSSFPALIWMMLLGSEPTAGQARLLEAALVAGVDHGPQAPSVAIARMAATCGVGLNSAMASGINVLGDAHGGAGQQCVELLDDVVTLTAEGETVETAAATVVSEWRQRNRYLPGFGHRFHPVDPRREPLLALVDAAVAASEVRGLHATAARAVEKEINRGRSRPIPMNIDGATAVIYAELGFPAPLARGLFVLSRSVGILAHAWEESQSGLRNKGPIPRDVLPTYLGQDH